MASTYNKKIKSLEDRRQTFVDGMLWTKLTQGQTNPFSNPRKEDLTDELECRGINTNNLYETELQQELQETLEGLQRSLLLCAVIQL